MSGTGLILGGNKYLVPGVEVVNWLDDPRQVPPVTDFYERTKWIRGIVFHTVHGTRGKLLPGLKATSTKGEAYAKYQAHTSDEKSWDGTMDTDGGMLWQNDPLKRATWHAGGANPYTLGIETVQEANGDMYAGQVENLVKVANVLTRVLKIPRTLPVQHTASCDVPDMTWLAAIHDHPTDVCGGYWHCNQSKDRGTGDCGVFIPQALLRAGWIGLDYRKGEHITFWKKIQTELGVAADGVPGPNTRAALERAGYRDAQLVKMPEDGPSAGGVATAVGIAAIGGILAAYIARRPK